MIDSVVAASGQEGELLGVLEYICASLGVPFDPTRASEEVRTIMRETPEDLQRSAQVKLAHAAESLGVQLITRQLTVKEALRIVAAGPPVIATRRDDQGRDHWVLITKASGTRGYLPPVREGNGGVWLRAEAIARQIGVKSADTVLEWQVGQPATPLDDMAGIAATHLDGDPHASHHGGHGPPHVGRHRLSPLARVWALLRSEKRDLSIVIIYAIAVGVLSLATPITAMAVVNTAAMATLVQQLLVLSIALFVSLGLAAFIQVLQHVVVEFIQRRIFVNVAAELAYRLPRVSLKAYDEHHGPELVNRFFDVLTVQKAGATLLLDGITLALQTLIGLMLLAFYHQYLLGLDVILLGCLAFLFFVLGRGAVKSAIRKSRAKYAVAGWLEEMARHPVSFKLGGGPAFAMQRADQLSREYLLARESHYHILIRQVAFALFLQASASSALLALGGWLVIEGQLTLGQLVAAEIVLTLVVASFSKLGKQLESYYDLLAAMDKLGHLLDLPLERDFGTTHLDSARGAAVRISEVCFSYDHRRGNALSNFTLEIQPGERIALFGPNGAGKSTLVDLLFGMRLPDHGRIEIDGIDLRDVKLESFRNHVAIVKNVEIFEGSIMANVRMGRDEVTVADIRNALAQVALLDDVLDLPDGMHTVLGTGGAPLSLGQAERLMLARALAGKPRLLVLDETLDNMEPSVRDRVLPAVLGPEAPWTLLVVTHSEQVAALCDRQVRLERSLSDSHATNGALHHA